MGDIAVDATGCYSSRQLTILSLGDGIKGGKVTLLARCSHYGCGGTGQGVRQDPGDIDWGDEGLGAMSKEGGLA